MKRFAVLMAAVLLTTGAAQAPVTANKDAPLIITADETLEWHRNDQKYIARGNASAEQDGISIKAQTLSADYKDTQKSSMDIHRLTAEGGVQIDSQGNTATGERAVYDVAGGVATMTGDDLRLTSPDQTVTAKERFEYDVKAGRLSAYGDAVVTRAQDTLKADAVSAQFENDKATGKRKLKELTADGNVVIVTPTETVRGQKGVYRADTNIATLKGGVRIERGPNILEGDEAEVNLNTNVSRMIGGTSTEGGRVRGVFYPGSTDTGTAAPAQPQAPQPVLQAPQQAQPAPVPAPVQQPIKLTPPRSLTAP
jgi:lipopolysaccharide export system protein LptA